MDVTGRTYHETEYEFVDLATGGVPDDSSARDGKLMTLAFSDISAGQRLAGVAADGDVVVVAVEQHGPGSATLTYRTADGKLDERILTTALMEGVSARPLIGTPPRKL